MKLILQKPVKKIGNKGDVVVVKDGYAQNFLIPQGFAVPATASMIREHELSKQKEGKAKQIDAERGDKAARMLSGRTVHLQAKASPEGTLFASIKARAIIEAAKDQVGAQLTETELDLPVIKSIGEHRVKAKPSGAQTEFIVKVTTKK